MIDLLVGVRMLARRAELVLAALEEMGYVPATSRLPGRARPSSGVTSADFDLFVVELGGREWKRAIALPRLPARDTSTTPVPTAAGLEEADAAAALAAATRRRSTRPRHALIAHLRGARRAVAARPPPLLTSGGHAAGRSADARLPWTRGEAEVIGDSARGDAYALARLVVDGERIVEADAPGMARPLAGLTLLEAAAVPGRDARRRRGRDALGARRPRGAASRRGSRSR